LIKTRWDKELHSYNTTNRTKTFREMGIIKQDTCHLWESTDGRTAKSTAAEGRTDTTHHLCMIAAGVWLPKKSPSKWNTSSPKQTASLYQYHTHVAMKDGRKKPSSD
jgi:hypothetical protein